MRVPLPCFRTTNADPRPADARGSCVRACVRGTALFEDVGGSGGSSTVQGQSITINVDRHSSKGHLADVMASMSVEDEAAAGERGEGECRQSGWSCPASLAAPRRSSLLAQLQTAQQVISLALIADSWNRGWPADDDLLDLLDGA
eukprot:COSAG01_NODE_356_length_18316_cov_24.401493_7_plen_145_part_00